MKNILDIMDEVGIELTKIGDKTYRGFCPFHDDGKIPNFTIYVDTDSFYCFACNVGGNVISFVMKYYNLSYEEAKNKVYGDEIYNDLLSSLMNNYDKIDYKKVLNKTISGIVKTKLQNLNGEQRSQLMNILKDFDSLLVKNELVDKIRFDQIFQNMLMMINTIEEEK